ncbi:PLP2 [Candida oxycetoniae]|uniref:PLP2 n=1 Tax=Candida oxycetoniae TaxID=497107 RepID=A0AAI9WYF3_9ASCO|nr:PLP2 [Candida oxycetoniae]KAI3405306.2 PLP2 [Candida oxycetoniae]
MKIPVEVDLDEDTEWNDILRAHGVIPEKPPSPTEQLEEALEEAVRKQHETRLDNKDLEELDELEDQEDEEFLNYYKQKRMAELKKLAEKKKFGSVLPVDKKEYNEQVTNASKETYVIVHLSLQSSLQSRLLSSLMVQMAAIFPELKFCDISAQRCIENYPESNCPTLIIYHNAQVQKQFITLTQLGGNATTLNDLEKVLVDVGAVKESDKRLIINKQEEEDGGDGENGLQDARRLRFKRKPVREDTNTNTNTNINSDDIDDFYD